MPALTKHYLSQYLVGLIVLCSFACSDMGEEFDAAPGEKSFGRSANLVYACEVAAQSSDGTTWRYETKEIMNLMREIRLTVYQGDTAYGPIALPKVDTDTFSDDNLTVRLLQSGIGKSIQVDHRNVGLTARSENGWCSERSSDRYADAQPGDSWSSNDGAYDTFSIRMDDQCSNPCSFGVKSNMTLRSVVYEVDGWVISESNDPESGFSTSYTFNTSGKRIMKATGFDHYGNFVATTTKEFELVIPQVDHGNQPGQTTSQNPARVPYYYQYNNGLYPSASCQNTSIAMVLGFLGANIHPDEITREFTKDRAQSVHGLRDVFNTLARRYGVQEIYSTREGTLAQLKASLDRGKPAIIHGYFTGYGHVVVVTGYDAGGYYVNDPAGTWSQVFQGGYPNAWNESTQGKGIYYSRDAFERAVATYDGRTFTNLDVHLLQ